MDTRAAAAGLRADTRLGFFLSCESSQSSSNRSVRVWFRADSFVSAATITASKAATVGAPELLLASPIPAGVGRGEVVVAQGPQISVLQLRHVYLVSSSFIMYLHPCWSSVSILHCAFFVDGHLANLSCFGSYFFPVDDVSGPPQTLQIFTGSSSWVWVWVNCVPVLGPGFFASPTLIPR